MILKLYSTEPNRNCKVGKYNSWSEISAGCVVDVFCAGYLSGKCSFEENYFAKHERFGPITFSTKKNNVSCLSF